MAKSKNYVIPRKPFNPRIVHLYDIAAMVAVFLLMLRLMPIGQTLDFSAGFNQKSEAYLQAEHQDLVEIFEDGDVNRAVFRELFETSCLQNGGYVYNDGNSHYFYMDGAQGTGYYQEDEDGNKVRADKRDGDNPRGLIVGDRCLSVMENGQIFVDDLEGTSGLMDAYVDTEVDFEQIVKIMFNDEISYRDAATIWHLIQQETIIGYNGRSIWFQDTSEGVHRFYRATEYEGVVDMGTVEGDLWDVMVIDDRYMIYAKNGNLYLHSMETDETTYIPFDEWTDLGELKQLAYRIGLDGKVRVYALNSVRCTYYDLSGNGVEIEQMIRMDGFTTENISGLYVTTVRDTSYMWLREPGQYVHITQD